MEKLIPNRSYYLKWFVTLLVITLIIKWLIAIYFPLTGDEAYFAVWGKFLSIGYYDHTPLVGWILYIMLKLGQSNLILRMPTIIATTILAIAIFCFLKSYDYRKAFLISVLYLISPINLGAMFITTDVPLIFFSFFSGMFIFYALKKNDNLFYYFLSGLCLGLAFFSKYFAVLLALAYIVYFLAAKKSWKRTFGFLLLFLMVLPFGLINLYWNYTHGWANLMFNLDTRNVGATFNWHFIVLYLLVIFYIVTPPIFYYLLKHWKKLFQKLEYPEFSILVISFVVPFIFFLCLSTIKSIGLHWPLSFVPFVYLSLICYLSSTDIIRSIKFMVVFTAIHLILMAAIIFTPVQTWQRFGIKGHQYSDLVFILKHNAVRDQLNQYNRNYIIASPSYAKAVLMYIDSNDYSPTFGHGSVHGRQGDFITDFRTMKNKNFAILDTKKPKLEDYTPYFKSVKVEKFKLYDAKFYVVLGDQFNYPKYRDVVLRNIYERYWQVPKAVPHTPSFYCEKYFADQNHGMCQ